MIRPTDRLIAFYHWLIFLNWHLNVLHFGGVPLGYANVKTLTEASCRNCQPDLIEFKPTVMVGVAAVWESVRKGVLSKLKQASPIQQKILGRIQS